MSQQQKPDLTCETAKELVLRLYGLKVLNICEMASYYDRNFHIQVSPSHNNPHLETLSPNGYTLKVSNPINTAELGHFESIDYALKFLHEKGLRVPLPVTNLRGSTWSTENLPILPQFGSSQESISYASCGIHVFTYISGNTMDSVPYTEDILQQRGRLLGQFHNSLEDFSNEHLCNKDIFWSIYHLSDIAPFMEELEKEKSELVSDVLRSYDKEIKPLLWEFRKGYIHGDFNETNVLIRKTAIGYIVDGILDLEEMHYGPYVWDVGLMLAYVSLDSNDMDPIEAMGHSLAGYLQLRTLSSEEISLLKLCIACRLCQSLVLGAHSYRLDPSNSYLIRSSRSGWSRLKLIWNTPNEIVMERWKGIRERLK